MQTNGPIWCPRSVQMQGSASTKYVLRPSTTRPIRDLACEVAWEQSTFVLYVICLAATEYGRTPPRCVCKSWGRECSRATSTMSPRLMPSSLSITMASHMYPVVWIQTEDGSTRGYVVPNTFLWTMFMDVARFSRLSTSMMGR